MPARTAAVAVVGNLHLDILVSAPDRPRKGETVLGSAWAEKCGGKGGNQAVEAARHGAEVAMIGAVGEDGFGAKLLGNLQASNVGTDHVRVVPGIGSGMSVAILDRGGDYGAVIVPGANWCVTSDHIALADEVFRSAAVLLLQNEALEAINLDAARHARGGQARIILNAAPVRATAPDLLDLVDIVVVNGLEAEMLGADPVEDLEGASRAAERLLALVPSVIVTAGPSGLAVAERGAETATVPAHKVEVISTHGAGDAFIGALAARLASGSDLLAAAVYANAAAAALVATPDDARHRLEPGDATRILRT